MLSRSKMRRLRLGLMVLVLTLVATACLEEGDGTGATGEDGEPAGGGTVQIIGAFPGEEAQAFRDSMQPFTDETGINVEYEGITGFETVVTTRVAGGDLPDIALFPQPGLLMDIQEQTDALPINEYMDIDAVEEQMIPGFLDATRDEEGNAYGLPMRMAVKSVIWMPVPEFEEAGYEVPETYEDLIALEDQIIEDGGTPWCLGMEAGDSTGWVGTDWVEEYMLRIHGPEVYDQWVTNELAFDSPEVREAFEAFERVFTKEGNVVGGQQGLLNIPFGDSPNAMFEEEPGCYLHRQGNFITGFFPEDIQEDLDSNVMAGYFPAMEDGFDGAPVLAGGDLAMLIQDSEEARQVMEFMASPEFGEPWAERGDWLSPNVNFDESVYPNDVIRAVYRTAADADVLRYDASDMMPGAVGAGSFWTGIVDWVSGRQDLDQVLTNIENSWPADG